MSSDNPFAYRPTMSLRAESTHVVTPQMINAMRTMRRWVFVPAILASVVGGTGVMFVLLGGVGMLLGAAEGDNSGEVTDAIIGLCMFLFVSAVNLALAVLLFRLARNAGRFVNGGHGAALVGAVRAHRDVWWLFGMAILVAFAVFAAAVLFELVAS